MLILIPILFLLLVSIILTGIILWRPRMGITWFVSTITAFITWLVILFMRFRIPETFTVGFQDTPGVITFSAKLLSDSISWPYAWALSASLLACTLVFAIHLSVKDTNLPGRFTLPASMIFGSVGLWAIYSANLNNLILAWAAIDLLWLLFMLLGSQDHQAILTAFAVRGFGLFLAVSAAFTQQADIPLTFPIENTTSNTLVFLGAAIRLGSIPLGGKILEKNISNKDLHFFINLVIAASALIYITRGSVGISTGLESIFLGVAGILALLCGLTWLIFNPGTGKVWLWVSGISVLSLIAALIREEQASLAWGIVLILPGSLLLYTHYRPRFLTIWTLAGLIMLCTLPFTPAWQGIRIYPLPDQFIRHGFGWLFWLLAQTLLLAGYLIAIRKPKLSLPGSDRWVEIIYPIGLVFLPLTHISILVFGEPGLTNDLQGFPALSLSLFSLVSIALAFVSSAVVTRNSQLVLRVSNSLMKITPYKWAARTIEGLFRLISQLVSFIDRILEGEGGILWTLLIVLLLFALWFQVGAGG